MLIEDIEGVKPGGGPGGESFVFGRCRVGLQGNQNMPIRGMREALCY